MDKSIQQLIDENFPGFSFNKNIITTAEKKLEEEGKSKALRYLKVMRITEERFPDYYFSGQRFIKAYNLLDSKGEDAVIDYFDSVKEPKKEGNLKAPVKCIIVAVSRPFDQWPVYKASENVQYFIYNSMKDVVTAHKARLINVSGKDRFKKWAEKVNVDLCGCLGGNGDVDRANKTFGSAFETYKGVETKVKNRNKNRKKKLENENKYREECGKSFLEPEPDEKAYDDYGFLLQPPGINHSIIIVSGDHQKPYQGRSDCIILPDHVILDEKDKKPKKKDRELTPLEQRRKQEQYAEIYNNYARDQKAPIKSPIPASRLSTVPCFQRPDLTSNTNRRMRLSHQEKAKQSLLVLIKVKEDWVLVDLRGLLRNVYSRNLIARKKAVTVADLLNLVTTNPILDTKRNICNFHYKPEVLGVVSLEPKKSGPKFAETLQNGEGCVLGVDLGKINPVAAKVYNYSGNELKEEVCRIDLKNHKIRQYEKRNIQSVKSQILLDQSILNELKRFGPKWDAIRYEMRETALSRLSEEDRLTIRSNDFYAPEEAKYIVCKRLGINIDDVSWDTLVGSETTLSDMCLENGGQESDVYWNKTKRKSNRSKKIKEEFEYTKRSNYGWKKECKPKTDKELWNRFNEEIYKAQRESPKYQQLSKWRKELLRSIVNHVVKMTEGVTKGQKLIIAIEDLVTSGGFFDDRKGIYEPGWNNFFKTKKSRPWFIKMLKTTFKELAKNRGYIVVEVNHWWTSQRCPKCKHVAKENRSKENRELFRCVQCGWEGHADFDVATYNIADVAVTGKNIKKPKQPIKPKSAKPKRVKVKSSGLMVAKTQ